MSIHMLVTRSGSTGDPRDVNFYSQSLEASEFEPQGRPNVFPTSETRCWNNSNHEFPKVTQKEATAV